MIIQMMLTLGIALQCDGLHKSQAQPSHPFCINNECLSSCTPQIWPEYDFIVVGAGTSGSVVASRLSEYKEVTVLLIEAGHEVAEQADEAVVETPAVHFTLWNGDRTWKYMSEPQEFAAYAYNRNMVPLIKGKGIGGTHSVNNMLFQRACPDLFSEWEHSRHAWKWDREDVHKYYKKMENVFLREPFNSSSRGTCGPVKVTQNKRAFLEDLYKQIMTEANVPIVNCNSGSHLGFCVPEFTVRSGKRFSAANAYLDPVRGRANLHVITRATVEKVLSYGRMITGVEFVYENKRVQIKAQGEVILAAGAYNNPKILLQSGIGPKQDLRSLGISPLVDNPAVGQGLKIPVAVPLRFTFSNSKSVLRPELYSDKSVLTEYITRKQGILGDVADLEGILNMMIEPSPSQCPDVTFKFSSTLPDYSAEMLGNHNIRKDIQDTHFTENADGFTVYAQLNQPLSSGYVTLRSNQSSDAPFIQPNLLSAQKDVQKLVTGILQFQKSIQSVPSFADISHAAPYDPCVERSIGQPDDAYWECYVRTFATANFNPSSTVKMGFAYDAKAATDARQIVKFVRHLRVTGSSVAPTALGVDTTATSIMIAEKLSDMIVTKWKMHSGKRPKGKTLLGSEPDVVQKVIVRTS